MRAPITLDLHLPNFNYPDVGADQVFDKLVDIATTAESSGFSSISLMDHLHQIPGVGPEENWMFDGNTMLSALAARTKTVTLGTLVGGVTYRNPALLAKITTTLDIISGGRAWFGIGAAWFENEHKAYGVNFPPLGTRFEMLEECLQITRSMFTQDKTSFAGKHFSVDGAMNNPKPIRGDIPIVIGGSGEKKTLRMVAQYADGCNIGGDLEAVKRLLGILDEHCENVGRDTAQITKTKIGLLALGRSADEAQGKVDFFKSVLPPDRQGMVIGGTADEVAEQAAAFKAIGVDALTLMVPDVHDLEIVELAGKTLGPVFA